MPDPCGLVVKNGTNRFPVSARPGPRSSIQISTCPLPEGASQPSSTRPSAASRAQEVDDHLLELDRISLDFDRRSIAHRDGHALLQAGHAAQERSEIQGLRLGRGQAGEAAVGLQEAAQRFRPTRDHGQAAAHVVLPIARARLPGH